MRDTTQAAGRTDADGFAFARPHVLFLLAAAALAGTVTFCILLAHSLTVVRMVDAAQYTDSVPDGFLWDISASKQEGRAVFTGWACVQGQPMHAVDIRVALYHPGDDTYALLPTQMTPDETATQAVNDGRGYALGGFTAVVPVNRLAHPLCEYEICIAYRTEPYNFLAHTAEMAEVMG